MQAGILHVSYNKVVYAASEFELLYKNKQKPDKKYIAIYRKQQSHKHKTLKTLKLTLIKLMVCQFKI